MHTLRLASVCTALLVLACSSTRGDAVLLIGSGNPANDAVIQSMLRAQGDTVTIGPTYNSFSGGNLSAYKDVLLVPSGSSSTQGDMPMSGQQALMNYVSAGGGLVTGAMPIPGTVAQPDFQTLGPAIPATSSGIGATNNSVTFTALTSNPVMNANLPSSFTFQTSGGADGSITGAYFLPKLGATAFYSTNQGYSGLGIYSSADGVVGWNYGQGRVLSISTLLDSTSLANSNFDTLVENSLNWARNGGSPGIGTGPIPPIQPVDPIIIDPVPEPAGVLVWGAGLAGLALAAYRGRRGNA